MDWEEPKTFLEEIDEKISLLMDFHILNRRTTRKEREVRYILSKCKNRERMDTKLHDVLAGRITIDDLIRKELYA